MTAEPENLMSWPKAQLIDEIVKLRRLLASQMRRGDALEMESGVNRDYEPFIHVHWGDMAGQLAPDEARVHGLRMLECAEAAEADAALIRGMRAMEFEEEVGFALLRLIREHRTGDPHRSA